MTEPKFRDSDIEWALSLGYIEGDKDSDRVLDRLKWAAQQYLSLKSLENFAIVPVKPDKELSRFIFDLTNTGVNYLGDDEYTAIINAARIKEPPHS